MKIQDPHLSHWVCPLVSFLMGSPHLAHLYIETT
jgi:hypothetical protein